MASKRKASTRWADAEFTTMIEILLGASQGATLQQVADALEDESKTKEAYFSMLRRLKAKYKEVKNLHDKSGFWWNYERDVVTADESIWAPLLRVSVLLNLYIMLIAQLQGRARAAEVAVHFPSMV